MPYGIYKQHAQWGSDNTNHTMDGVFYEWAADAVVAALESDASPARLAYDFRETITKVAHGESVDVGGHVVARVKSPIITHETLNDVMEIDRVVRVYHTGQVLDVSNEYAPEVMMFDDGSVEISRSYSRDSPYEWTLLDGYSGQHRYTGPIMHKSEYVGGRMARDIIDRPGIYVVTTVSYVGSDEEDAPDEPAGWVVAFKEAEPGS